MLIYWVLVALMKFQYTFNIIIIIKSLLIKFGIDKMYYGNHQISFKQMLLKIRIGVLSNELLKH